MLEYDNTVSDLSFVVLTEATWDNELWLSVRGKAGQHLDDI